MRTQPRMIRRVMIATREGVMQCPRCSYVLSYSDALLCRVGETHYCPRCWSRIAESVEAPALTPAGATEPVATHSCQQTDDQAARKRP